MKKLFSAIIIILYCSVLSFAQTVKLDVSRYVADGDSAYQSYTYSERLKFYTGNHYAKYERNIGSFYAGISPNFWIITRCEYLKEEVMLYMIPNPTLVYWDFRKQKYYVFENSIGKRSFYVPPHLLKRIEKLLEKKI